VSIAPAALAAPRTDVSAAGLRDAIRDDLIANALRRRRIEGERAIRRPDLVAYRCDLPSPEVNHVVVARIHEAGDVDRSIADAIAEFCGSFFWWLGPDSSPVDLGERLVANGLQFLAEIPGMALDLADLEGDDVVPPPPGIRVEPVLDASGVAAFHEVLARGFPEDFVDAATTDAIVAATARSADETGHREPIGVPTRWIGWVDDRPVTTTRLHTGAGVAGVYGVVTVDDARRRGYGEAITRRALRAARDAGLRIAALQASDAGRGVYERVGFRELIRYRLYQWDGPAA
jgi:GNAT superfamily N-acetyltransferase